MQRKLLLFITLFLLLTMIPLVGSADDAPRLYVWDADTPYEPGDRPPHDAITWYQIVGKSQRYLFLPAGMDASNLRIYLTNAKSIYIGEEKLQSGDVTDLFVPGETLKVKVGPYKYTLEVSQAQNIATVYFRTESGYISAISQSKERHEPGSISVYDEHGDLTYHDEFEYIRCRGNGSFDFPKKSFHIKLNQGKSLLGMDKGKTWLLISNYKDHSLIRNAITLGMASAAGTVYTPDYRFVTVYGNCNYYGVYLMTEKVQINNGRVSITDLEEPTEEANEKDLDKYPIAGDKKYKLDAIKYSQIPNNPEDISGGYLLMLDLRKRYWLSTSGFVTENGQTVEIKSPEYASKEQAEYAKSLIQSFENAIRAEDGIDPASGKHYTELADMDSIVSKYLVEEISKNLDGNKTSFYIYKDSDRVDSKMYFGPMWDYDNTFGNYDSNVYRGSLLDPANLFTAIEDNEPFYWFPQLYKHEDFQQEVRKAYAERFRPCLEVLLGLREPSEATGKLMSLSAYEELLTPAAAQNFQRWPTFGLKSRIFSAQTGEDYPENIEYLRNFLTKRMEYLDSIWLK